MAEEMGEDDSAVRASRAADRAFLGLEPSGHQRAAFTLTAGLARHDGRLYGGTAVAAAIAMFEQASERRALWATVQFVSGAATVGDRIECEVEVLAAGRRTSQLRVTGRRDGEVLFGALGATAALKERAVQGVFETPPEVDPPEACEPFRFPIPRHLQDMADAGIERRMEIRVARRPTPGSGKLLFWARARDHLATPAILGYLADMVPMSVVHASGHMGGGTSLDNTLRLGFPGETDWVLLQLDPHLALGGYGHGTAHLWSPDGALLATASQTAALLVLD